MKSQTQPIIAAIAMSGLALIATAAVGESKPDIVFILADDPGYPDLDCPSKPTATAFAPSSMAPRALKP